MMEGIGPSLVSRGYRKWCSCFEASSKTNCPLQIFIENINLHPYRALCTRQPDGRLGKGVSNMETEQSQGGVTEEAFQALLRRKEPA